MKAYEELGGGITGIHGKLPRVLFVCEREEGA
jgi:hypothetical protein